MWSARPGSLSNFRHAACTVPSIGTSRVNSDFTLKDTMILLSCIFSHVFARLGITELACLLSFLGFDSCVIVNFRKRRYAPIKNQIIVLSQIAKVQNKSLHFAVEQSTSLVERKVKTYKRSNMLTQQLSSLDAKKPRKVALV